MRRGTDEASRPTKRSERDEAEGNERRVLTGMGKFTRRRVLALGALGVASSILASCGAAPEPTAKPASQPTQPSPKSTEPPPAAKPTTAAAKPTEAPAAKATTAPAAKPAAAKKDVTLRFVTRGGAQGDHQREFAKRFADETGVKVQSEEIAWGDIFKKVQTQLVSGDLPDVIPTDNAWYPELAVKGTFLVLDPLVKASPPPNFEDYPFLDWCRIWTDGKLTGLSGECGVMNGVVFYNKQMVQEAGGKEPTNNWTMEEYLTLIKLVSQKKGVLGGSYQTQGGPHLDAMVRNWGRWILDPTRTKVELTHPQTMESLQWLAERVKEKVYPGREGGGEADALGAGKLFSMTTSPAQNQAVVAATKGKVEYGAVIAPKGRAATETPPRRVFSPYANRHCVSAKTKFPDEAYALNVKTTGHDCMKWLVLNRGKQPGILSVWRDPEVLKIYPIFKDIADEMAKCTDVYGIPANTRLTEYRDRMNAELQPFLYAEKPVGEATLGEVQKKLQDIVSLPRP